MGRPARILSSADLAKLETEAHRLDDVDDLCRYLDVSRSTYLRWMKAGAALPPGDPDFRRQFWSIVQTARLASKRTLLGVVTDIAVNGETEANRLSASKYLLDRVHRLAAHVALQNPDGSNIGGTTAGPSASDLAKLPTEKLREYHAAQAKLLELGALAVAQDDDDSTDA